MASHARTRAPAGRVAIAATLAAVAAAVLVSVLVAGHAGPATASAAPALPVAAAPAALPLAAPAAGPSTQPEPDPEPAPGSDAAPAQPGESDLPPGEPAAQEPAGAEPSTSQASRRSVPVRAEPAPAAASPVMVAGTPCTAAASACVDLAAGHAWLIEAGTVTRGPVPIMTGDQDDPTPIGNFQVQWKAEQYTSREYLVQMPYSVFFADGGIAFHEGRQDTPSAGCVKLAHDDAVAFFTTLQVGDRVQVR